MGQQDTIKDLKANIKNMDALSRTSLAKVKGIAKMALVALESPAGCMALDSLGFALQTIVDEADVCLDSIAHEARAAGAEYPDEAAQRRFDAMWAVRRKLQDEAIAFGLIKS